MLFEIYADNLTKEDIKNNRITENKRVIILGNNLLVLKFNKAFNTYTFPKIDPQGNDIFPLKTAVKEIVDEEISNINETITIIEHFPDNSYKNTYYLAKLKGEPKLTENPVETFQITSVLEALELFENTVPKQDKGYEKLNREFIALTNSI